MEESEISEMCGMHERCEKLLHMSENLKRKYAVAGTPYTGDIILNWIRFNCLGLAPVAGCCERSNRPLEPIQWRKLHMSDSLTVNGVQQY
jgi:hypothetical protein